MPKTLHDNFRDWHSSAFPCGYGTGEPHTLGVLRSFLLACEDDGRYQYPILEAACGPAVAWLLINTLCGGLDLIDYGTSPRFGWLTPEGLRLRDYFATTALDEIISVATSDVDTPCFPDLCQCDTPCSNPFWVSRPRAAADR